MADDANIQTYARLLKLTPVSELYADRRAPGTSRDWFDEQKSNRRRRSVLFICTVLLPSVLFAAYIWLVAADRYVSEARYVIRMPSSSSPTTPDAMLQSVGLGRTSDDAYAVTEFMMSRDAVSYLVRNSRLRDAVGDRRGDFLWRFPNFFTPNNDEGLFRHYRRIVSAVYDPTSNVGTLRVEAFSPEAAERVATGLLSAAEALVNRLNDRAHRDAIALAQSEVDRAEARVTEAQARLTDFRVHESMIDPTHATLAGLEAISKLSIDSAQLNMQLSELRRISPQSPQIATLQTRQSAIEDQIAIERRKLAGDRDSIATKISQFERLSLEREFSDRVLATTLTALEVARMDAQRQQIYLERVAQPNLPDYPTYPYRVLWTLAVVITSYMLFRIIDVVLADMRRHASDE
jgi:capsular polysaccharide transport system permease protein